MDTVRFGVIGLGAMGSFHVGYLDRVEGVTLGAVCDVDAERVERTAKKFESLPAPDGTKRASIGRFGNFQDLIRSGSVDAVLIATPHPQHPDVAIAAFDAGIHVLCEKPVAVSVKEARRMNDAAARHPRVKFGLMYQMRTVPLYRKLRELIQDGELGDISRITWLITDWFRTWTYYASGGWRATWAGEGGGVLINQCPHNLDLIQWLTGLFPSRVTAVGFVGKTHPIEVEDEISAILEYPSGAVGHFVTTTGEAPGTNRLEIAGDRGKIVAEAGKLTFTRTRKGVRETRETSKEMFANPETWTIDVPLPASPAEPHKLITENFVRAVLKDEPLISPGAEGVRGLEIGNAMLMAGLTRRPVELPLDGDAYELFLKEMQKQYGGKKTLQTKAVSPADMASSFSKP
jgi:predicted dehydrogenase